MKQVTIGRLSGLARTYMMDDDATIQDVLDLSEIVLDAKEELTRNNEKVSPMQTVEDGDIISITAQVKGN